MDNFIAETAVFEVLVGDRWLEWNRLERPIDKQWEGNIMLLYKPRTRVRFISPQGERIEST